MSIKIDFDDYYINQGDSNYAGITFKNGTTVKKYGCGVCCYSMLICRDQDITSVSGKKSVINQVISNATNSNGDLTYNFGTINNVSYTDKKVKDIAAQVHEGVPAIVQLYGHYVVVNGLDADASGFDAYLIKDPGSRANNKLSQPMKTYGTSIKSKRILE